MLLAVILTVSPLQLLKTGNEQLHALVTKADANVEQVAQKADGFIDFGELARRALGPQWEKLSPKQQNEMAATLRAVLKASYAHQVLGQGAPTSETIWGAENIDGDEAVVTSTVPFAGERVSVDYKLYKKGGTWRVYDVVTDGVSLVEAYADQFRSVIAKKGFEGLIDTLKKRKAQLEAPKTASVAK